MILNHKDDLKAFREAVHAWARETAPPEQAHRWLDAKESNEQLEIQRWWLGECHKVGLAIPHWPEAYGGGGLGLAHQIIIADEFVKANTPGPGVFNVALNHVPATLIPYGSEYQKQKYLPSVPHGAVWCQGFSEPEAGSDLAALRTRAVRDGDAYVVNGHKIWSSHSMYARYCLLLARTDFEAKKQRGISYFILDMTAPGVEVRPIRKSTGASRFGEIFLDDVRIPVEDRIGDENQGWTIAQATLSSERGVMFFDRTEREQPSVQRFYAQALSNNAAWLQDDQLRREFMRVFAERQALRRHIRALLKENPQEGVWSVTPALIKLSSSILRARLTELQVRMADLEGLLVTGETPASQGSMYEYLDSFGDTIGGGTNEIMRNLVAERSLNMPR